MVTITDYSLPVKQPNRNFPHVVEEHFFSEADLRMGDTAGTTDTDSKTSSKKEVEGYTRINR
jgi:hypothetical protein